MLKKIFTLTQNSYSYPRGFTLIEILVTVAIVSLMLIVSVPAFRNYKYRNDLSRGADMVQSAIYETKNLALAPQTDKVESTEYYAIKFTNGSNKYEIFEADNISSLGNLINTFYLPSQVIFGTDTDQTIYFSIQNQGKIGDSSENINITIKHGKLTTDNTKTITVSYVTGQVSVE